MIKNKTPQLHVAGQIPKYLIDRKLDQALKLHEEQEKKINRIPAGKLFHLIILLSYYSTTIMNVVQCMLNINIFKA